MKKTELIPVIHVVSDSQAMENVKLCMSLGIKKVFIIDHHNRDRVRSLLSLNYVLKYTFPDLWVGINFLEGKDDVGKILSITPKEEDKFDAIWTDNTVNEEDWEGRNKETKIFGGFMFKYQSYTSAPEELYSKAMKCTDVITTSGEGTGKAMTGSKQQKIADLVAKFGDHPSAIASGVSIHNIKDYLGRYDYLLVASSITESRTELIIEEKLKELVSAINSQRNE